METILPLLLVALLAAFGFILWEPVGQIRRLRGTPALPIAALPGAGQAKAIGRAGGGALQSPIAGAPCVLWQIEVQEYRSSARSGRWVTVHKQTSDAPITLDDGTGRVWALPAGAKLVLGDDLRAGRGLLDSMPPSVEAAIERLGIPLRGWLGFRRPLRVRERRIAAGEQILALGLAEPAAGQLRLCSTSATPLILADRSERDMLARLYWQVGLSLSCALLALALVGGLILRVWR